MEALERRVPPTPVRVILVWVDEEGRLTKAADTHPHLPDDEQYFRKLPGVSGKGGANQWGEAASGDRECSA